MIDGQGLRTNVDFQDSQVREQSCQTAPVAVTLGQQYAFLE
jgi:hypothetical protein